MHRWQAAWLPANPKTQSAEGLRVRPSETYCERGIMSSQKKSPNPSKLDQIVADARRNSSQREQGYREQALKLYPWICGRCAREFSRENLQQLTVHHRDHNHDHNPADGSNWELLCVYCHDNEHSRYIDGAQGSLNQPAAADGGTFNPFAGLKALMNKS